MRTLEFLSIYTPALLIRHIIKTRRRFLLRCLIRGIDEETSEQYLDEVAQQFLADRYIIGECPVCSNPNAYGDQCERCGSTLSPTKVKNPRSTLSGSKPVMRSTKNWYLPLDRMQPDIEKYVIVHIEWKSNVFGQCQSSSVKESS